MSTGGIQSIFIFNTIINGIIIDGIYWEINSKPRLLFKKLNIKYPNNIVMDC